MHAGERALDYRRHARLLVVAGVHRPQHHQQPERVQLAHRAVVEGAVGGAEQTWPSPAQQFDAGHAFQDLFALFARRKQRQRLVALGVIADDVAVTQLAARGVAEVTLHSADREEGPVPRVHR